MDFCVDYPRYKEVEQDKSDKWSKCPKTNQKTMTKICNCYLGNTSQENSFRELPDYRGAGDLPNLNWNYLSECWCCCWWISKQWKSYWWNSIKWESSSSGASTRPPSSALSPKAHIYNLKTNFRFKIRNMWQYSDINCWNWNADYFLTIPHEARWFSVYSCSFLAKLSLVKSQKIK